MKTSVLACVALLFFCTQTSGQPDHDWLRKIDPVVLSQVRSGQLADVIIVMPQSTTIQDARLIAGKDQKAAFVFETLQAHAIESQEEVSGYLQSHQVPFQSLWIVNVIQAEVDESMLHAIAKLTTVRHVIENSQMQNIPLVEIQGDQAVNRSVVEWGIDRINADDVWALGYRGQNVVVGGQDTGYEWDHAALKNRYRGYIQTADSVNHNYNWHDAIHQFDTLHNDSNNICGLDVPEPCDDSGHGTHTMGTMIGLDGDNMIGVAPDATWCGCRNMERGYGRLYTYLECFQWFIAPTDLNNQNPDPTKSPHVINNSWGCPPIEGCNASNWGILDMAVNASRMAGIVVVASAGNSGNSGCGSVSSPPAIFEGSFSIGATAINDTIAGFSSRGPVVVDSSFRIKPNVSAPGVGIRSARLGGDYTFSSGTSMAGPHVAGVVALIISANPSLAGEVETIEDIIEETAVLKTTDQECGGVPGSSIPNNTYGYGRVDALAAVEKALTITHSVQYEVTTDAFFVFPNPAQHQLSISSHVHKGHVVFQLHDLQGRLCAQEVFNVYKNDIQQINIESRSPGLYVVTLISDTVFQSTKIIIE